MGDSLAPAWMLSLAHQPIYQALPLLRGGYIPRTPGKEVPVLLFSILGWSAWHQDLNNSPCALAA